MTDQLDRKYWPSPAMSQEDCDCLRAVATRIVREASPWWPLSTYNVYKALKRDPETPASFKDATVVDWCMATTRRALWGGTLKKCWWHPPESLIAEGIGPKRPFRFHSDGTLSYFHRRPQNPTPIKRRRQAWDIPTVHLAQMPPEIVQRVLKLVSDRDKQTVARRNERAWK